MRLLAPLAILLVGCPKPPMFEAWEAIGSAGDACHTVRTPEEAARQLLLEHPERITIRLAPQDLDPAWHLDDMALLEAGVGHPMAKFEIHVVSGGGAWSDCPIYECTEDTVAERLGIGGPTREPLDREAMFAIMLMPFVAPLLIHGPLTGPWAAPPDFPVVSHVVKTDDAVVTRFALTRLGPAEGPPEVRFRIKWDHYGCVVASTWSVPLSDAPLFEALEASGLTRGIPLVSATHVETTVGEVVAGPVILPPAEIAPTPSWPAPLGTAPAELCDATDAATVHALGASDLPCPRGRTPLWYAIRRNRAEVVEALLAHGADRVFHVNYFVDAPFIDPAVRELLLSEPTEAERIRFTFWADRLHRARLDVLEERVPHWFEPTVFTGWDEVDAHRLLDEPFAPVAIAALGLDRLAAWRSRFPTCAFCRQVDALPIASNDPPSRVAALAGPPHAVEEGPWVRRETWPDGWAEYVRTRPDGPWELYRIALPAIDPFGGAVYGMPIDATWVVLGPWFYDATPGHRYWLFRNGKEYARYRLEDDGQGNVAWAVIEFGSR